MSGVVRRLRQRSGGEDGFTLVEVMVASGILFVTLTALAYTSTVAFADIGLARQRQAAIGLANQALEQVRALPYDVVTRGLSNSDLAVPDPNIVASGGEYRFGGERIPHANFTGSVRPLVPHRSTTTVGTTSYTVGVYPTHYGDDPASGVYRVTVLVDWTKPVRQGVSTRVRSSTLIHSPAGASGTAPFPTPRQPFFYATAAAHPGSVDVTGTLGALTLERAALLLGERVSNMQVEQLSAVQGLVRTGGATLDLAGAEPQTAGYQQVSAAATDNPGAGSTADTATTPAQSTHALSATAGGSRIELATSGGDSGTAHATVRAADGQCQNLDGLAQIDGLPCGSSSSDQEATTTATVRLEAGAVSLGDALLASLAEPAGASPNQGRAFTNRAIGPEGTTCATAPANGDGCAATAVSRALGTLNLAGLPAAAPPPPLWEGQLVQLTGWADRASAESGAGTSAPAVTLAGVIRYWAGAAMGYVDLVVDQFTPSGLVVPVAPLEVVVDARSGPVDIRITPSLTVGGTGVSDSAPAGCVAPCARTAVEARARAPLLGTIGYVATQNGATIADLTIAVNLGALQAQASYTPAPTGA